MKIRVRRVTDEGVARLSGTGQPPRTGLAERLTDAAILEAIAAEGELMTALLERLVAAPTTLGHEEAGQVVMEEAFRELGLEPVDVPMDAAALRAHPGHSPFSWDVAGKRNVVATWGPVAGDPAPSDPASGQLPRSLILNGHIDVVSPEPLERWARAPFEPVREGDWLYGRGCSDMKCGLAAIVGAVAGLRRLGLAPLAPVHLQSVVEEECTGNGTLACLLAGYRADGAIVAEPFGAAITTSQVGVLWFTVTVRGTPGHAGDDHHAGEDHHAGDPAAAGAGTGVAPHLFDPALIDATGHVMGEGAAAEADEDGSGNPIEGAFPIIRALRRLEADRNLAIPERYAAYRHPINLNVGTIRGGDWASTAPGECTVGFRIALYPDESVGALQRQIEAVVAEAASLDRRLRADPPTVAYDGFACDGYEIPNDHPLVEALAAAYARQAGEPPVRIATTGTSDARIFGLFGGTPAVCFGPYAENAHGVDERVYLPSVVSAAQTLGLFIRDWCGLSSE
jgi:acetylornithine deacetylase